MVALQRNDPAQALVLLDPLQSECSSSSKFFELLGLANEAAGNSARAEESLRTALSLNPKSAQLLTELGAACFRHGKAGEAEQYLDRALTLDPSDEAALKYAIGVAVQQQDWQRSARFFQRIGVTKNPEIVKRDPILVYWFAQTLIETRQSADIDSLLPGDRRFMPPQLLFSLGTLFAQHRMYDRAVRYLSSVPPEDADDAVYFNLGLSYSHLRKYGEARRSYFAAAGKRPESPDIYLHVGLDYSASGEPRMAIPWLFRARAMAPSRTDISYTLAGQLLNLGYFDTAQEILGAALAVRPNDSLLLTADGDLKRVQGKVADAIGSYEKALQGQPGFIAALVGLARANTSQGKYSEARNILISALAADREDPSANGELGLLEAQAGEWPVALEHLNRAWTQDRSNPVVAISLARCYRRTNNPLEALKLLNSIAPAMQDSAPFHLELAQIYTQLHRTAEAKAANDAFGRIQAKTRADFLRFESSRTYIH